MLEQIQPGMLFGWVKEIGLPAIILIIWYFDHKRLNGFENLVKAFKRLAEEGQEREKVALECMQMAVACINRMEQKIADNVFCPIVRKESGK
jgi:hypothetical protein